MSATRKTSDHPGASVLVNTLAKCGLRHAVISPGSRNAPLTIAFDAHPGITTHVVIDERSAAHFALGLALRSGTPAAVVCTSGTAAMNHGPALAEALHHSIPIISITADRPVNARGRGHGQSVFQKNMFGENCHYSIEIDELTMSEEEIASKSSEAYLESEYTGKPIHINVPFEEPLYGLTEFDENLGEHDYRTKPTFEELSFLNDYTRPLFIGGSVPFFNRENAMLYAPGICENFSGATGKAVISSGDLALRVLGGRFDEKHRPDVVVTWGTPTMSKALRNEIIRLEIPHYHIEQDSCSWDTFFTLKKTLYSDLNMISMGSGMNVDEEYMNAWEELKVEVENYGEQPWSDLKAFEMILGSEHAKGATVHLSNSTSARYAQIVPLAEGVKLHANRGVAGIDGCTSTAVGDATAADGTEMVFLVSGDVAFMYDLNGLASAQSLPKNLRIIVINNGGGEIFRWLKGPESTGLVEKYFETKPKTSVKAAAEYCGLSYFCGVDIDSALEGINKLVSTDGPAILELATDPSVSESVYKNLLAKNNERTQLDND